MSDHRRRQREGDWAERHEAQQVTQALFRYSDLVVDSVRTTSPVMIDKTTVTALSPITE